MINCCQTKIYPSKTSMSPLQQKNVSSPTNCQHTIPKPNRHWMLSMAPNIQQRIQMNRQQQPQPFTPLKRAQIRRIYQKQPCWDSYSSHKSIKTVIPPPAIVRSLLGRYTRQTWTVWANQKNNVGIHGSNSFRNTDRKKTPIRYFNKINIIIIFFTKSTDRNVKNHCTIRLWAKINRRRVNIVMLGKTTKMFTFKSHAYN